MSKFIKFRDNTGTNYIVDSKIIKAVSYRDGNEYIKLFYTDMDEPALYFFESSRVANYYYDLIWEQLNK